MKSVKTLAVTLALAALAPMSAHAVLLTDAEYPFVKLTTGSSYTVEHSLYPLIPTVYQATSGWLTLAFADDSSRDPAEWASIEFALSDFSHEVDGSIWSYDWEIYGLNADARADLNADGRLSVTVSSTGGDFWWKKSFLTVNASAVSVPEPGTLLLLGTGLLAVGLTSRRRRTKAS